jgi:hypothetical protein
MCSLRNSVSIDEESRSMVADCLAALVLMDPERRCFKLRQQLREAAAEGPEKDHLRDLRVASIAAAQHLLSASHHAVVAEFVGYNSRALCCTVSETNLEPFYRVILHKAD